MKYDEYHIFSPYESYYNFWRRKRSRLILDNKVFDLPFFSLNQSNAFNRGLLQVVCKGQFKSLQFLRKTRSITTISGRLPILAGGPHVP